MKEIVNPFVDATVDCFVTMMEITPALKDIIFKKPPIEYTDICAIIGLSGDAQGMVALSFSLDTAKKVSSMFLGEELEDEDEITDAIAEVINIIAGAAKAKIRDKKMSISLPTVMRGKKFMLDVPKDVPTMSISFVLPEIGDMNIVVALRLNETP